MDNELKRSVAALERIAAALESIDNELKRIAAALESMAESFAKRVHCDAAPADLAPAPAVQPEKQESEAPIEKKKREPKKAAETPVTAETTETKSQPEIVQNVKKDFGRDEVRAALIEFREKNGDAAAFELLQKVGKVKRLSELTSEFFEPVIHAARGEV